MDPNAIMLSIIVPVYNVELYLKECLDSLCTQDVPKTSYEIICVDDGSSDGSGAILDDFARHFSNVTVIHQENGGVSAARNTGLDVAKGNYVWFVDSDDFIAADFLKDIFEYLKLCEFDQYSILPAEFNDGEAYTPYTQVLPGQYSEKVKDYLITRILRRSSIEGIGLRFNTKITYQEDNVFYTTLYPHLKKKEEIAHRIGYYYRIRKGSLSRGGVNTKRILSSLIAGASDMQRLYETDGDRYNGYAFVLYSFMTLVMQTIAASPKTYGKHMEQVREKRLFPLKYSREYTVNKVKPEDTFFRKKKRIRSLSYTRTGFWLLRWCIKLHLLYYY